MKVAVRGQRHAILEHFRQYGSITSMEAFELYGATRLSAIVYDLRKVYVIETESIATKNRFGETCIYGRYVFKGVKES